MHIEYQTVNPVFLSVPTLTLCYDKPEGYFFHIYPPFPDGSFEQFKIGDLILFPGSPISEVRQIIAFHPSADLVITMPPSERKYLSGTFISMRLSDLRQFDIYFRCDCV